MNPYISLFNPISEHCSRLTRCTTATTSGEFAFSNVCKYRCDFFCIIRTTIMWRIHTHIENTWKKQISRAVLVKAVPTAIIVTHRVILCIIPSHGDCGATGTPIVKITPLHTRCTGMYSNFYMLISQQASTAASTSDLLRDLRFSRASTHTWTDCSIPVRNFRKKRSKIRNRWWRKDKHETNRNPENRSIWERVWITTVPGITNNYRYVQNKRSIYVRYGKSHPNYKNKSGLPCDTSSATVFLDYVAFKLSIRSENNMY